MNRAAFRGAARFAAAVGMLVATLGTVTPAAPGQALGAVIAITPNELGGSSGFVFNPSLSGRGESAAAFDGEIDTHGWALFDAAGQEQMIDNGVARGATVSGNGCVFLRARLEFPQPPTTGGTTQTVFYVTDRCAPGRVDFPIFATNATNFGPMPMALSHTGQLAAIMVPTGSESPNAVLRVDTTNGALAEMPLPEAYLDWDEDHGLSISGDGNVLAATAFGIDFANSTFESFIDVFTWQAGASQPQIVSDVVGGPASAWPSLSGDGRFVSFTSAQQLAGPEPGIGPWVFVHDRANGQVSRVSPAGGASYQSSISRDGTQVAYTASNPCDYEGTQFDDIEFDCPGVRIEVAFGPAPGVTAVGSPETIVAITGATEGGQVEQPVISGNGRWVAWISNAGPDFGFPNLFGQNAYMRRRDPALTIDLLDFGTIAANTTLVLPAAVRNTGRTSVSLDSISAAGGQFAVVGGGTCAGGSSLPPGASCTVNIRYSAPNSTSQSQGTLTVAEVGFDSISGQGPLIGRSSLATTTSSTTTQPGPTTTPAPGQTTTTRPTPTTTTTTIPGQVTLTADPSPIDFGAVAVGIGSGIRTLTVTNIGTGTGSVITELAGDHPQDFFVARNGCNETVLAPNQSCTMDIMMIPLAGGIRTATLVLTAGGATGGVDMFGEGHFAPQLIASPGAITTAGLTTIIGRGFPPGGAFTVRIGSTGQEITATADALGMFRIPMSALANELELGHYMLEVDALPNVFELVRGQLVVVLATFEPQGPGGPVFGPEALIVTRG